MFGNLLSIAFTIERPLGPTAQVRTSLLKGRIDNVSLLLANLVRHRIHPRIRQAQRQ
jgi:hypothetical protein